MNPVTTQVALSSSPPCTWKLSGGSPPCIRVFRTALAFVPAPPAHEPEESLAPAAEIEGAMAHWDRALEAIDFYDTGHRDRSLRDWRRLVAARPLTAREVAILRGVANRILVSLRRNENHGPSRR